MTSYLFSGGRFLDPHKDELQDGISVLVENGTVKEVSDRPINSGSAARIDLRGRTLTCRVVDSSPLPPRPEEAAETAESGRGLILVEALASAWDWEDVPEGKSVWASFEF